MTTRTQYTRPSLGVPAPRPRHRSLDEYELLGHYEHWREDLAPTKALGLRALRWGVPWYRVAPQPGKFDEPDHIGEGQAQRARSR